MKKIVGDWTTEVELTDDEAKEICLAGKGAECCAFLAMDAKGWECLRMSFPTNNVIFQRLEDGTMTAKGRGGWKGCAWEGEV